MLNTLLSYQSLLYNKGATRFFCILALADVINKIWNIRGYQGSISQTRVHNIWFSHCWLPNFSLSDIYRSLHFTPQLSYNLCYALVFDPSDSQGSNYSHMSLCSIRPTSKILLVQWPFGQMPQNMSFAVLWGQWPPYKIQQAEMIH